MIFTTEVNLRPKFTTPAKEDEVLKGFGYEMSISLQICFSWSKKVEIATIFQRFWNVFRNKMFLDLLEDFSTVSYLFDEFLY